MRQTPFPLATAFLKGLRENMDEHTLEGLRAVLTRPASTSPRPRLIVELTPAEKNYVEAALRTGSTPQDVCARLNLSPVALGVFCRHRGIER